MLGAVAPQECNNRYRRLQKTSSSSIYGIFLDGDIRHTCWEASGAGCQSKKQGAS